MSIQKQVAKITEESCIGCTKCIDACPFDAILGASKQIHVVLSEYCTGCTLCIPPCPVSCIELIPTAQEKLANLAKTRRLARKERLAKKAQAKAQADKLAIPSNFQAAILACLARTEKKEKTVPPWQAPHE